MNEKYTINKDYHGDVKIIRNTNKKVNLTKATDILEHNSKQQDSFKDITTISNNKSVCLTKPKDLSKKVSYEDAFPPMDYEKLKVPHNDSNIKYNIKNTTNTLNNKIKIIIAIIIASPIILLTKIGQTFILSTFVMLILGSPLIMLLLFAVIISSIVRYKTNRMTKQECSKRIFHTITITIISYIVWFILFGLVLVID